MLKLTKKEGTYSISLWIPEHTSPRVNSLLLLLSLLYSILSWSAQLMLLTLALKVKRTMLVFLFTSNPLQLTSLRLVFYFSALIILAGMHHPSNEFYFCCACKGVRYIQFLLKIVVTSYCFFLLFINTVHYIAVILKQISVTLIKWCHIFMVTMISFSAGLYFCFFCHQSTRLSRMAQSKMMQIFDAWVPKQNYQNKVFP